MIHCQNISDEIMPTEFGYTYESPYFVIPSYIPYLDGITFSHLKVYEIIFRFWNDNQHCFLTIEDLCDRANMDEVQDALNFFQKLGEIEIKIKRGKKYILITQKQGVTALK